MSKFEHITVEKAKQLMDSTPVTVADIRDTESFQKSHLKDAYHLSNENLEDFLLNTDLDRPLIVYCYHGHSSQPAAEFLSDRGFETVYSLVGGFSAWQ